IAVFPYVFQTLPHIPVSKRAAYVVTMFGIFVGTSIIMAIVTGALIYLTSEDRVVLQMREKGIEVQRKRISDEIEARRAQQAKIEDQANQAEDFGQRQYLLSEVARKAKEIQALTDLQRNVAFSPDILPIDFSSFVTGGGYEIPKDIRYAFLDGLSGSRDA